MTTFVSVGNARQPFPRLLDALRPLATMLPRPIVVQHGHTPFAASGFEAIAFMGMEEFETRLAAAQLVIIHAGAGSLMHALAARKVPVVMPRQARHGEHVNDHQVELAQALADTDRIALANEAEDLDQAVVTALRRQRERQSLDRAGSTDTVENRMLALVRQVLADCMQHGIKGAGI